MDDDQLLNKVVPNAREHIATFIKNTNDPVNQEIKSFADKKLSEANIAKRQYVEDFHISYTTLKIDIETKLKWNDKEIKIEIAGRDLFYGNSIDRWKTHNPDKDNAIKLLEITLLKDWEVQRLFLSTSVRDKLMNHYGGRTLNIVYNHK